LKAKIFTSQKKAIAFLQKSTFYKGAIAVKMGVNIALTDLIKKQEIQSKIHPDDL